MEENVEFDHGSFLTERFLPIAAFVSLFLSCHCVNRCVQKPVINQRLIVLQKPTDPSRHLVQQTAVPLANRPKTTTEVATEVLVVVVKKFATVVVVVLTGPLPPTKNVKVKHTLCIYPNHTCDDIDPPHY